MKIVKQEEKCGCTIACIAMVLKKSYKEVRKDFVNDFELDGLSLKDVAKYLCDYGKEIITKKVAFYHHKDFGQVEMLKPFAPMHIVWIHGRFDSDSHVVVMDADGRLYCSGGTSSEDIVNSYAITAVIGIY